MDLNIRRWKQEDACSLAHYANNPKIAACLRNGFPYPYSEEDACFFINTARRTHTDKAWELAITVNDEAIGGITLRFGDDIYSYNADLGYWVGEEYWHRGIATEAVYRVCHTAFRDTDAVRIQAEVMADNPASIQVLQKNQFIQEGYFCNRVYKNGRLIDSVLFATFK